MDVVLSLLCKQRMGTELCDLGTAPQVSVTVPKYEELGTWNLEFSLWNLEFSL
jgi:hypothetical protein